MAPPWPSVCARWNRAYWQGMTGRDLLLVTPKGYIDYFLTLIPKRNIPAGVLNAHVSANASSSPSRSAVSIFMHPQNRSAPAVKMRCWLYLPHLLIVTAATICSAATYCRLWIHPGRYMQPIIHKLQELEEEEDDDALLLALATVATTRKKRKHWWWVHPVVKRRSQHGIYHHLAKELELWGEISANTGTHVTWLPSRNLNALLALWFECIRTIRIKPVHVWFGSTTSVI